MTRPTAVLTFRLASVLTLLLFIAIIVVASLKEFKTEDAFMFYRYAIHFRQGLGISWNADGVATYGLTSLGWFFVILILSFLPINPIAVLIAASGLMFLVAVLLMTRTVTAHAQSDAMRSAWAAFPLVALPLVLQPYFDMEILNGMETMLSFLANALIVAAALSLCRKPSVERAVWLGAAGFFAFFVRPDNGLCAALIPALLFLLWPSFKLKYSVVAEALLFALIGIQLIWAGHYFGTPVPLAFYLKSLHGYRGYISPVNSGVEFARFLGMASPYLSACAVIGWRRSDLRFLAIFMVPVLLTSFYLLTVIQIMGYNARYYVPFLPFVILPAVLVVDRWLAEGRSLAWRALPKQRIVTATAVLGVAFIAISSGSKAWANHVARRTVLYLEPERITNATHPLPAPDAAMRCRVMGDAILHSLPKGTTLAASEVGYVGASAPQVDIIDLVGLNDREIAMQGFSMTRLLERSPDLIWLPHQGYTWLRREIWTDPRFLAQYDVYEGVESYGLAIRKQSPLHDVIEHQLATAWPHLFPNTEMQDYRVQGLKPAETKGAQIAAAN